MARAGAATLPAILALLALVILFAGSTFSVWKTPTVSSHVPNANEPAGLNRRMLVGSMGMGALVPSLPALAYETYKDTNLGFEFVYPTGLQKSENGVYNYFVKDLIEPLESVGVRVTDTKRRSLEEIGDAKAVGEKLLDDTVPKGAPREIISAVSKTVNGRRVDIIEYAYQWKFDDATAARLGRKKFQLHNRALVTVDARKQYLVLAGCEEKRWPIVGDQITLAVDTFKLIFD